MIQGLSPTVLKLKVNLSKLIRFLSPKKAGNLRISYISPENRSKSVRLKSKRNLSGNPLVVFGILTQLAKNFVFMDSFQGIICLSQLPAFNDTVLTWKNLGYF